MTMRPIVYKDIKTGKYAIDESGNVFSLDGEKAYPMALNEDRDGYIKVGLMQNDGKQNQFAIHTLVAFTYLGEPPKEMKYPSVNHKDNNKKRNHFSNLEWMEIGTNSSIREAAKGEACGKSKLKEEQVIEIRKLLAQGLSHVKIGKMFNVHSSTIGYIATGKTWKHLV